MLFISINYNLPLIGLKLILYLLNKTRINDDYLFTNKQ